LQLRYQKIIEKLGAGLISCSAIHPRGLPRGILADEIKISMKLDKSRPWLEWRDEKFY